MAAGANGGRTGASIAVLALRLWTGLNFTFTHGIAKLRDPEAFLETPMMQGFPAPEVTGWFAILAEVVGGALLALGLLTRTMAAWLLATMLGAAFIAHADAPWADREAALTYAVILLFFVLHGGGAASVDAWLTRRRRRRSPW